MANHKLTAVTDAIRRVWIITLTAAVVGLGVGYYYERNLAARYESGELVNVQVLEEAIYEQNRRDAIALASE